MPQADILTLRGENGVVNLNNIRTCLTVFVAWIVLAGCAVNPVTGQRELTLVSDQRAIAIGQEQYAPAQQMQGGPYSVDPELSAYVNRVGQKVAAQSGVDLPYEFVVLNHSVPNAWALPGGKIAINRGLLAELGSEAELAAVLGHEVAHAAARHGAKRIERGLLTQGLVLGTAVMVGNQDYGAYAVQGAQLAAGLLNQKYSRDAEREADYYGTRFMAQAGYDPQAAVSLQETFVRLSKASGPRSQGYLQGLFASHPPSQERVGNNARLVSQLRGEGISGGEMGVANYARVSSRLQAAQPAFAAYARAQKAYEENDLDAALREVNAALSQADEQAIFHSMRGVIRYKQERFKDAITNFDRAIQRDNGYFAHFLQRGLTHKEVDARSAAKADLSQSVRLMPTGLAYNALGELAEADGDAESAKRYYAQASSDGSAVGTAARMSLARIEIADQPGKYLQAQAALDSSGDLIIVLNNKSPAPVQDILVQIEATTAAGVVTRSVNIPLLGAGRQGQVKAPSAIQDIRDRLLKINAYPVSARIGR